MNNILKTIDKSKSRQIAIDSGLVGLATGLAYFLSHLSPESFGTLAAPLAVAVTLGLAAIKKHLPADADVETPPVGSLKAQSLTNLERKRLGDYLKDYNTADQTPAYLGTEIDDNAIITTIHDNALKRPSIYRHFKIGGEWASAFATGMPSDPVAYFWPEVLGDPVRLKAEQKRIHELHLRALAERLDPSPYRDHLHVKTVPVGSQRALEEVSGGKLEVKVGEVVQAVASHLEAR